MHSQDIKPSNVIHRGSDIIFTDFSSSSRFEISPTTSTENPARTRHGRGSDISSPGHIFVEMLILIDRRTVSDFRAFGIARKEATSHGFSVPNG
ncbi:hypothetical protein V2W45_1461810 [Cenococcum geophilum]